MASFLFIDIETTGLGSNAAIVEIAAIPFIDGEIKEPFHSMVKPHRDAQIDKKAFEITKINIDDIWTFPDAKDVLNEFFKWVQSHETKFNLAGHNVSFDRSKLYSLCCRNGEYSSFITNFRNRDLDTLSIARKIYKGKKEKPSGFTLEELCSYFGIETKVHHRALDDIQNTIKVYLELEKLITIKEQREEDLPYPDRIRKYIDLKYIQLNPEGDVFLTKEAMRSPSAMRVILNELYELTCDPVLHIQYSE